ncbi:MAG: Fur family transcriptional regulator [Campylobacterota bacterium]|nr:Fur family transcriptional regulator [Campylobacterota bacterium]
MVENSKISNNIKSILKNKGIKYTEQRAIILDILLKKENNKHINAEELHKIVKNNYPNQNIGIATIYRTLNSLKDVQLISSIPFEKNGKMYEINIKDEHHDHLICTQCQNIIEFFDKELEDRQEIIAKKNGFLILDHTMQIYGICQKCQIKNKG